jgi:hypothetical protein
LLPRKVSSDTWLLHPATSRTATPSTKLRSCSLATSVSAAAADLALLLYLLVLLLLLPPPLLLLLQTGAWYDIPRQQAQASYPTSGFGPGYATYTYATQQRPTQLWYHDHA